MGKFLMNEINKSVIDFQHQGSSNYLYSNLQSTLYLKRKLYCFVRIILSLFFIRNFFFNFYSSFCSSKKSSLFLFIFLCFSFIHVGLFIYLIFFNNLFFLFIYLFFCFEVEIFSHCEYFLFSEIRTMYIIRR